MHRFNFIKKTGCPDGVSGHPEKINFEKNRKPDVERLSHHEQETFSIIPSEISKRRWFLKTSIFRTTFEKSDIRKWGNWLSGRAAG